MPTHQNVAHLIALVEAAKQEADRLGSGAAGPAGHLEQALSAAQALSGSGTRPDEGVRVEDLTTENDK